MEGASALARLQAAPSRPSSVRRGRRRKKAPLHLFFKWGRAVCSSARCPLSLH